MLDQLRFDSRRFSLRGEVERIKPPIASPTSLLLLQSRVDAYEAPVVVRQCYRERRAVYDDWGNLAGYRRVKVCD